MLLSRVSRTLFGCNLLQHKRFLQDRRGKSRVPQFNPPPSPGSQQKEASIPTPGWPNAAVLLFDKFVKETSTGEWEKVYRGVPEDELRSFLRATGDKMFMGAIFVNKSKMIGKAIYTFGPWCEGNEGSVHNGAIVTIHDAVIGTVSHRVCGISVTAYIDTNFLCPIPIETSTLVTSRVDSVDGRKIKLSSQIMNMDEKILYSESTSLFILSGIFE